eukprot:2111733-Rhodomonas_salina.2
MCSLAFNCAACSHLASRRPVTFRGATMTTVKQNKRRSRFQCKVWAEFPRLRAPGFACVQERAGARGAGSSCRAAVLLSPCLASTFSLPSSLALSIPLRSLRLI